MACIGQKKKAYSGVLCENLKEGDNLEDMGVEGRMILNVKEIEWEDVE